MAAANGVILGDALFLDPLLEHGEPHGGAVLTPIEVLEPWSDLAKRGTDPGEVRSLKGAGRGDAAFVEVAAASFARSARRALLLTIEEVGGSDAGPAAASFLWLIALPGGAAGAFAVAALGAISFT